MQWPSPAVNVPGMEPMSSEATEPLLQWAHLHPPPHSSNHLQGM